MLTQQNEKQRAKLIRDLTKQAIPGNTAWQRVESLQGFDADYSPADEGEAPTGAQW